ncbi:MAG: acid phosphatase, partial [Candidatus Sericytochromatia bacterium]|nr:acid phosphatase [Candidatus Sericytochromatia bacterium]
KITHYNVLRTVEDIFKLPYAGASSSADPITGCWK